MVEELKYFKIEGEITKEKIEDLIALADSEMKRYDNLQMSIKIFLNSIYGATASPYFVGFNKVVAESITLQGQDMIKYTSKLFNRYFKEFWHKDKKLHDQLGVKTPSRVLSDVVIYGDTDSVYISFSDVYKSIPNFTEGKEIEFIHNITNYRLKNYLKKSLDIFAKKYNTTNIQDLELETIAFSDILLEKKKYVLDLAWDDSNTYYQPQTKIKSTGVEMVQRGTPPFVRERMMDIIKILFKEKKKLNIPRFISLLKEMKEEYLLEKIENISMSRNVGDYEKGIKNDVDEFEINSRCPIHVRAAGYHNFLMNQKPDLKKKYSLIRSGDKVKYFHCVDKNNSGLDIFGYLPDEYPYEVAPEINYDLQYLKTMINPINRFIQVMGFPNITTSLFITKQLF